MSALTMGRRMAESRMTDSCKVTRKGERVWDEGAGEYVDSPVVIYLGRCRLKHSTAAGSDSSAGSQLVVVSQPEVHLPVSAVGVAPGDEVLMTSSPTRPDLVGRKFVVEGPFDGSQTTALRYRIGVSDGRV